MEALQRQLESIQSEQADAKVTRIGTTRPRPRETPLMLRIYDLSDLFAVAPAYQAEYPREFGQGTRLVFPLAGEDVRLTGGHGMGGGMGGMGMGGGMFQVDDKTKASDIKVSLTDLMRAIRDVIQPDGWKEKGGDANMTSLGNALLVSADEETHTQIRELLNLFRHRWGTLRTVSVQAWWLWLNDTQIRSLLGGATTPPGEMRAFGLVDDAAWSDLMQKLHANGTDPRQLGYRAAVTCYNGQTVHVMSDAQRLAVTDVRPIIVPSEGTTGPGSIALQPELSVVNEGAVLQVRPIANIAGKTVVLDVHSRVAVRHDVDQKQEAVEKPAATKDKTKGSELAVPAVDRNLQLLTHRLSTTLRVPIDRRMLVGGMTFEEQPTPGERSLYLFVKCGVQEIRNDQEEAPATPTLPKKASLPVPDSR